ncbi:tyrosine-type recombinase/integrase [Streptomyces diastatochromogenes]|uniref:tyrosine-type recombinase/integrase n=1 Tax=Streptomyces diastatochromogenes TaxID=42236 RepID=UPI0036B376B2
MRANKALEAAGSPVRVPNDGTPQDATLHDLRHFYASVLIKNGATPKQVQKRLGHARPSITLDVYTRLFDSDIDVTADIIEAALGQVP